MLKYSARRLLEAIPTLLGVFILSFFLVHAVPGNPAVIMLGTHATRHNIAMVTQEFGLNKPLPVQFLIWLWQLLHGNLGTSFTYNQSVWSLIWQNVPRDLSIVGIGTLLASVLSILQGLYQAKVRGSLPDQAITWVAYFLYSMPIFWLAVLLILWFSIDIPIFPPGGIQDPTQTVVTFGTWAAHIALPVICIALATVAYAGRFMRASVVDSLVQDYVRTARAKGTSEFSVLMKHAFRNSLLPQITLLGFSVPSLFAGALFVEEVFNYPGLGLLFWNAAGSRDYPIILGTTAVIGVLTVAGNLLADLLYGLADPRIAYD